MSVDSPAMDWLPSNGASLLTALNMPTPIYESPQGQQPRWVISHYNDCDPSLIRFVKHGRTSKQLDQVARWISGRWDPARWVPGDRVPKDIMRQVVGRLRQLEVAS